MTKLTENTDGGRPSTTLSPNQITDLKDHEKEMSPVTEEAITSLAQENKFIAFDGRKLKAFQHLGLTVDLMGGVELNNGMALVTTTIATDIIVRLHSLATDPAISEEKRIKVLKGIAAPITLLMGAKAKLISELAKARGLRDGVKNPPPKKRTKLNTTQQMGIAKPMEDG